MTPVVSLLATAVLAAAAAGPGPEAPIRFVDVSDACGIGTYTVEHAMGSGVAAADFDDDGDVDLFVPTDEGSADQLYRNLGDGRFEEIAVGAGVAGTGRSRSALWFDYDGDRRLDLLVTGDCWELRLLVPRHLHGPSVPPARRRPLRGRDGGRRARRGPHLIDHVTSRRLLRGDVNGDGRLDLMTCLWFGRARLALGRADGTFLDIGPSSGVGVPHSNHWQAMMHDFTGDGRVDIYEAIDFNANKLWVNQGHDFFIDVARDSGAGSAWNDMGLAYGDYDADGDLDIYITNIEGPGKHNVLYRNDTVEGIPAFTEVAEDAGVDSGGWGWGCTFLDADNDGRLDIAATNGWMEGPAEDDTSRLFLSRGGTPVRFDDVSAATGFDDSYWGSGLVAVDYDRDGDLDLVQACLATGAGPSRLRVLENRPGKAASRNGHLTIRPRMPGPNHRAIGAVVRVTPAGGATMTRVVTAGTSLLSQEPAEAHFGLGAAHVAARVVIEWPDGGRTELTEVPADRVLTVWARAGDVDRDGVVGAPDLALLLESWGPCPAAPASCPADFDASGSVDVADLVRLLDEWS